MAGDGGRWQEMAYIVDEEILELEVAVCDVALREESKRRGDHAHVHGGVLGLEALNPLHAREELAAEGEAQQQVDVRLLVEGGEALEDERVRALAHDTLLVDSVLHLVGRDQVALVQRLERVRHVRRLVHDDAHHAEGALAEHLAAQGRHPSRCV